MEKRKVSVDYSYQRGILGAGLAKGLELWVEFPQEQIWEGGLPAKGPDSVQHGGNKEHTILRLVLHEMGNAKEHLAWQSEEFK